MPLFRVKRQTNRAGGAWRTLYVGNEAGARKCYHDVFRRRQRGNLVLLDGNGLPVLWAPRPNGGAR